MTAEQRSYSDVLRDILRNVQDIVRLEVRLAKAEIREEAIAEIRQGGIKAQSLALLIGVGASAAVLAVSFLLLTVVYALSMIIPSWAAALAVGSALAAIAGVLLPMGMRRLKQLIPRQG